MNFKVFSSIGLTLAIASFLVEIDTRIVWAQPCRRPKCSVILPSGTRIGAGHLPSEAITEIETLIKQQRATVDHYLLLGDAYKQQGNYGLAQQRLSEGLELAKKNGDAEGQGIINRQLRGVMTQQRQIDPSRIQINPSRLQIRQ